MRCVADNEYQQRKNRTTLLGIVTYPMPKFYTKLSCYFGESRGVQGAGSSLQNYHIPLQQHSRFRGRIEAVKTGDRVDLR